MKLKYFLPSILMAFGSCSNQKSNSLDDKIQGTWELLSATTIEHGKQTTTNFTNDLKMIKVINKSHFSFLKHSTHANDSVSFDAGGGRYTIKGDEYTEYLDFYKDKNWEGKTFYFKVSFNQDTLIQKGVEKVEKANVDRVIIEKYIKLNK